MAARGTGYREKAGSRRPGVGRIWRLMKAFPLGAIGAVFVTLLILMALFPGSS